MEKSHGWVQNKQVVRDKLSWKLGGKETAIEK